MSVGFIYKIIFPNGKHYIGQTIKSLEQRKKCHKECSKNLNKTCYLYNAIRKFKMEDSFELIEIDSTNILEELNEMEKKYIIEYNSYYQNGCGYNMTHGGDGTIGYIFSDADKLKMSENIKKQKNTIEGKQKSSIAQKKRFENPEEIQKQCERMKKRNETHPDMGKRISESQIKRFENNPELKQKMSEEKINYFKNPASREKLSEGQKKRFKNNPEERKKNSRAKENKPFDITKFDDGTFIGTFIYQFQAVEYLKKEYNINTDFKISEVLQRKRRHSHRFVFTYK